MIIMLLYANAGIKFTQSNSSYGYELNGKEESDEVHGDGNIYYGFRIIIRK